LLADTILSSSADESSFMASPRGRWQRAARGLDPWAMNSSPVPTLEETRQTLEDFARKRFGVIPLNLVVERAVAASEGADFSVRHAAVEALARRMQSARRDELVVATRPSRSALGPYTTRRRGERTSKRPYETFLFAVAPARGSCSCPDFARSALGL